MQPRVTHLEWGRIDIGPGRSFRDAKLFPTGARGWDWNETGTRHVPGVQVAGVEELLEHGSRVIGSASRCSRAGSPWRVTTSFASKEAVGALIHTTC